MTKTILIVDDSMAVRTQVRVALAPAGFTVVEARDGLEGLHLIETQPEIAVVICDINMPNMNGIEMLEALHDRKIRPGLPILMLTTETRPTLLRQAKAKGASAWIVKPFKADILIRAVAHMAA